MLQLRWMFCVQEVVKVVSCSSGPKCFWSITTVSLVHSKHGLMVPRKIIRELVGLCRGFLITGAEAAPVNLISVASSRPNSC